MYGYEEEERVVFTDEEWAAMMADPTYFGYSCQQGHAIREDDPSYIALGCGTCWHIGENGESMYYDDNEPTEEELARFNAWADSLRSFPLIDCPTCGSDHVGEGAVARCKADHERKAARPQWKPNSWSRR